MSDNDTTTISSRQMEVELTLEKDGVPDERLHNQSYNSTSGDGIYINGSIGFLSHRIIRLHGSEQVNLRIGVFRRDNHPSCPIFRDSPQQRHEPNRLCPATTLVEMRVQSRSAWPRQRSTPCQTFHLSEIHQIHRCKLNFFSPSDSSLISTLTCAPIIQLLALTTCYVWWNQQPCSLPFVAVPTMRSSPLPTLQTCLPMPCSTKLPYLLVY